MWLVAPLEHAKDSKERLEFTDCHGIALYTSETRARAAVKDGLRSGDPLVGLFKLEGVYDADVSLQKVK